MCKDKNEENLLMDTSLILNLYSSVINAFRSSHQDVVCKIAVLKLLQKWLTCTCVGVQLLRKLQVGDLQLY